MPASGRPRTATGWIRATSGGHDRRARDRRRHAAAGNAGTGGARQLHARHVGAARDVAEAGNRYGRSRAVRYVQARRSERRATLDCHPLRGETAGRRRTTGRQTRTSIFPVFPPENRPRNASGMASSPSCTVSWLFSWPLFSKAPISR